MTVPVPIAFWLRSIQTWGSKLKFSPPWTSIIYTCCILQNKCICLTQNLRRWVLWVILDVKIKAHNGITYVRGTCRNECNFKRGGSTTYIATKSWNESTRGSSCVYKWIINLKVIGIANILTSKWKCWKKMHKKFNGAHNESGSIQKCVCSNKNTNKSLKFFLTWKP